MLGNDELFSGNIGETTVIVSLVTMGDALANDDFAFDVIGILYVELTETYTYPQQEKIDDFYDRIRNHKSVELIRDITDGLIERYCVITGKPTREQRELEMEQTKASTAKIEAETNLLNLEASGVTQKVVELEKENELLQKKLEEQKAEVERLRKELKERGILYKPEVDAKGKIHIAVTKVD